jgi:hypothetical protein
MRSPATTATCGHSEVEAGTFEVEGDTGILEGAPLPKRPVWPKGGKVAKDDQSFRQQKDSVVWAQAHVMADLAAANMCKAIVR